MALHHAPSAVRVDRPHRDQHPSHVEQGVVELHLSRHPIDPAYKLEEVLFSVERPHAAIVPRPGRRVRESEPASCAKSAQFAAADGSGFCRRAPDDDRQISQVRRITCVVSQPGQSTALDLAQCRFKPSHTTMPDLQGGHQARYRLTITAPGSPPDFHDDPRGTARLPRFAQSILKGHPARSTQRNNPRAPRRR